MTDSADYVVVGSGPAGIACTQALVAAGKRVTILDGGLQLESERSDAISGLLSSGDCGWTQSATAFLRAGLTASSSGILLKMSYGSDFPYRPIPGATAIACDSVDNRPSYARGGLSTVWGAAVLPYRQEDIGNWPISVDDLAPGYRAVLNWMPIAAREDALAEFFPLYTDRRTSLPMSRQAAALMAGFESHRAKLNAEGVHFGASRLAVRSHDGDRPLCVSCGLCMYGCPHSLIYASDQNLEAILATGRVRYRPGVAVQSVQESSAGVLINAIDREGHRTCFSADRVFLGAGILNTTAILLRSLHQYNTPVRILDSQYFLLPLLRLRGTEGVAYEPLHTLAQLFVEVFDKAISPYTIHLQTYTYNELMKDALLDKIGNLKKLFPVNSILGRLLLFQGYLHSSNSASISATLERNGDGDTLKLEPVLNAETGTRVRGLVRKLMKLAGATGFMPVSTMLQMGKPGRGFHTGGSFPMSVAPGAHETDTLGRPRGLLRVHAIDSSVLPSIPATTITFTVMANAYRIGLLAATASGGGPV